MLKLTVDGEEVEALPGETIWEAAFDRLRFELDTSEEGVRRIVYWHVHRFFGHLLDRPGSDKRPDDIEVLVPALSAECEALTLAEANRLVSRALYRLSREQGWRKLTLREQEKLGLTGRQWWPESAYAAAHARLGNPTGAGEWTLRAARSEGGQ